MSVKRIAVIGAGASGLAGIKCCLEVGIEPICFEQDCDIGGLWRYTEDVKENQGSVYKSCVANTSKEMMAYGDFPVPANYPPFLSHSNILRYMRLYAEHFQLIKHIKFNTSVRNIRKADDFDVTGRWTVTYGARYTDELNTDTFDGVMVCTGHHAYPNLPDFPGLSSFKGHVIHSHNYKRPEKFADKKVLLVGCGNSAVDIAVDISRTASQVYLSTRRGAWIVSRLGPFGVPADALSNSRVMFSLPRGILGCLVETICNWRADHSTMGLKPDHGVLQAHPTINDDLPLRVTNGSISIKPNVHEFTENGAVFEDGSIEEFDTVIFATGYNYKYPFLHDDILYSDKNDNDLYKYTFPPHLKHNTLGFVGLVQVVGSVIPASEIQARWFAHVMAGDVSLPSSEQMHADIERRKSSVQNNYVPTQRHALETFWVPFMDEIAEQFGVKPNLKRMFFTDPLFALRCFFGPCVPAQYRLEGLGKWEGARKTITDTLSNTMHGIDARKKRKAKKQESNQPKKSSHRMNIKGLKMFLPVEFILLMYLFLFTTFAVVSGF